MRCPSCNTENPDATKFCGNCGQGLDSTSANVSSKVKKPNKKPSLLKVIGGILIAIVALAIVGSLSETPPSTIDTASQPQEAAPTGVETRTQPQKAAATAPATSQKRLPKVSVENLSCKYDEFAVYVYGEAVNNTDSLLGYADFTATFYDSEGKILGTGIGNLTNLPSHEHRTIEIMAMGVDPHRISEYKVDVGSTLFE